MNHEIVEDKISQGILLLSNKKYEAAIELFKEVIQIDSREIDAYVNLGNAYANIERYDDAISAFENVLLLDNNYAVAYFSIGSVYILKNDKYKAIECFNKAEKNGYESSQMYQIMASIFFEANDEIQAMRNINKAIQLEPLDGELRILKVKIYLAYGKVELALDALDEMESILPDSFVVYDLKAQIYMAQGRTKEALGVVERGCNRFPDDYNLAVQKLKVLVLSDKNQEAHAWIDFMKQKGLYDSVIKESCIHEAALLVKEGCVEEAYQLLVDVNEKMEDNPDLLYLIIDILGKRGTKEELLMYSEKLMKEEYGDFYYATASFYHASSLEALERFEEAQKEYKILNMKLRKKTINNPAFYEGYLYRLLSHVKLKEYDKAIELADYIEKLYPEKADSHAFRSYIYKEMGNIQGEEEEKKVAKQLNPQFDI